MMMISFIVVSVILLSCISIGISFNTKSRVATSTQSTPSTTKLHANGETSKEPVPSVGGGAKNVNSKLIAGAGAVAAGYFGKQIMDGPVFTENVSLIGKNIVITGANTGLGKETAIKLASLGANLLLLCKTKDRGDAAVADIKSKTGSSVVSNIVCDLGDLKSVQTAAVEVQKRVKNIDVLLNNAGIMALPQRTQTKDGFEAHIGINHLGHFALTQHLLPLVAASSAGRIISVSSQAHRFGKDFRDDFMIEKPGAYDPWGAYGNSKLANILFINSLSEKLKSNPKYSNVFCASLHPGLCRTELGRYFFDVPKDMSPLVGVLAAPLIYFSKSAEQGAQTQIYLAATSKISMRDSGKFYDNSAVADRSSLADDADLAKWLWHESETRTGTNPNIV